MIMGALDRSGPVIGIMSHGVLYIVADRGHSHYRYAIGEEDPFTFVCLGCSGDRVGKQTELITHTTKLVERSKILGTKKVVCRRSPVDMIAGLPVEDVEDHIGDTEGGRIYRADQRSCDQLGNRMITD